MFLYWQGYEIDGSDTSFDLVLPESRQLTEFVELFLSLPIFTTDMEPQFHGAGDPHSDGSDILSRAEFLEMLRTGQYSETLSLDINCRHPEEMTPALRASIYALSAGRVPPEVSLHKPANPCTAPLIQNDFVRGERTVTLLIEPRNKLQEWYKNPEHPPEGYVRSAELFASTADLPCLSINVGPTSYYEYAIYLVETLQESFPGLAVAGGLDCGGGWTDGCTYAASIYCYDRLTFAVPSVKNAVKRLTEVDIVRPYRTFYHKKWQHEWVEGFLLSNSGRTESWDRTKQPVGRSLTAYSEHVEQALGLGTEFEQIAHTATDVSLPDPAVFRDTPLWGRVVAALTAIYEDFPGSRPASKVQTFADTAWYYTGYLAFFQASDSDEVYCDLRCKWQAAPYLRLLLSLREIGELDFLKTSTYDRRHK
jgi:hypothetical protein